jgi:hypothetical protein
MPTVDYFLVCRSIQQDINTGEMSFVNVLEDITPDAFPIVIPRAIAVSLWTFEPGEAKEHFQAALVVKLVGRPDTTFPMNFSQGINRCRAVQGVLDIPVPGPGEIRFEVLLNGQHRATHSIKVHPVGVQEGVEEGNAIGK